MKKSPQKNTSQFPPEQTPTPESASSNKPLLSKLTSTCGVDYDIGHYPFFIVSQKPRSGTRTVHFKGGHWQFMSGDFPTYNDLDVLLGVVRLFEMEEKLGKVIDAGEIADRKAVRVEVSGRTLCKFVGISASGSNFATIDSSMKRLTAITAFKYLSGRKYQDDYKPKRLQTVRFILYYDWIEKDNGKKILSIVIDKEFLENCKKRNYRIRFQAIQKIRGQVAKGCLFFIECNNYRESTWLPERRLFKFLGLDYPRRPQLRGKNPVGVAKEMKKFEKKMEQYNSKARELRHDVKKALNKLVAEGLIASWILRKRGHKGHEVKLYAIRKTNCYLKKTRRG